MLERAGAAGVTSIEANARAFMKCLIVKELLGLKDSHFLLGDFVAWLRQNSERFDLCVASGVLYHLLQPMEGLRLMSGAADRLLIWTHYYDPDIMNSNPDLAARFPTSEVVTTVDGFRHTAHRYEYAKALEWMGFCGGSHDHSFWLERGDILAYLSHQGYEQLDIAFEHLQHDHGPAFAVLARRSSRNATDSHPS
jgi:hypothetical protein